MLGKTNLISKMENKKPGKERRGEILDTGLNILHEEGKSKLTMGHIADKIGITEAAVYKHFKSKKEVIEKMAKKVFSLDPTSPKNIEKASSDKILKRFIESVFTKIENNREITSMLFHHELFTEYPKIEKYFTRHRRKKKEQLIKIIKKGKEENVFDKKVNPDTFATIIMGSIRMTVLEWRESNFSYSLSDKTKLLFDHIFRIIK